MRPCPRTCLALLGPALACLLAALLPACGDDDEPAGPQDAAVTADALLPSGTATPQDAAADADRPDAPLVPDVPDGAPEEGTEDAPSDTPQDAPADRDGSEEPDVAAPASRCEEDGGAITCERRTTTLLTGITGLAPREVHWQVPVGTPPPGGWPTVVFFQGTGMSAEGIWSAGPLAPYGGHALARTLRDLLDEGFAVVAPEAHAQGTGAWDTNLAPWNVSWEQSPDHRLMQDLLAGLEDGAFGAVDPDRLYAMGLSSGGYMTSRMALSYPGRFRALAVHSASWATCAAAACVVPDPPDDHPPTLFLHGALDAVVPKWTMDLYAGRLEDQETPVEVVVDPLAGHRWLEAAPEAVTEWFTAW